MSSTYDYEDIDDKHYFCPLCHADVICKHIGKYPVSLITQYRCSKCEYFFEDRIEQPVFQRIAAPLPL